MAGYVGRRVLHYDVLEILGNGGMGEVYKARDLKLERTVALKFLPPGLTRDPMAKQRFLQEARITSALNHRHICIVHDIDETLEGQVFISMEFLEGETLGERIAAGPLSLSEASTVAAHIAAGLSRAHESGIVHRDLKPANIMFSPDGSAKILDFGVATVFTEVAVRPDDWQAGTTAYMSPEQVRGDPVDARSDIWSLGVILYEMLTGSRPFRSDYPQALAYSILHEKESPPRRLRADISDSLEGIILRCLEKSADDRFQDASSLRDALLRAGRPSRDRAEPAAKSIAVLPFALLGPHNDITFIGEGLAEEIIAKLSRLAKLRVVSRTSVMNYDRTGKSTQQVARELNVQYLLAGSVRQHGTNLRVTTNLIDVDLDSYVWAETYNGTMSEIFDIQSDVAGRVVKALRVRLSPNDRRALKKKATADTGAYQSYLKGRYFWSQRTRDGLDSAIKYFEEAIQRDPGFAPAWAGIADAHMLLSDYHSVPRKETYARAEAAVRRALEIDDRLAEAHTSLGLLAMLNKWDWATAEKEFQIAIEASPNYATAHHWRAENLAYQGRSKEALAEINLAVSLDPLSPAAMKDLGLIQYYSRDYEGALASVAKALELNQNFASVHRLRSLAYQALGRFDDALAEHNRWASGINIGQEEAAARAQCLAAAGKREQALAILGTLPSPKEAGGNTARGIALIHTALGNRNPAFAYLERAYETGADALGTIKVDPKLDPLRDDPRFNMLLAKVGLA
jgi:serine/threonine protein kinase/tetratricopeptide (TPR) repeat protein